MKTSLAVGILALTVLSFGCHRASVRDYTHGEPLARQKGESHVQSFKSSVNWDVAKEKRGEQPTGAQKAFEHIRNGGQLPEGLTRQSLETYLRIARKAVAEGIDTTGTQAVRIKVAEEALKRMK